MKQILLTIILLSGLNLLGQTNCTTATTLSTDGTYTTPNYTTSTYQASSCLDSGTGVKAIWYKFTPNYNGSITLSSDLSVNNGTTYTNDTRITIFTSAGNNCTSLNCVASNDDVGGTNFLSTVTTNVVLGTTYYIQWDNFWGLETTTPDLGFQFTFTYNAILCDSPYDGPFWNADLYTTNTARIYWAQASGSPTNYDIDWSTSLTAPQGTGTIVTNNPITLYPANTGTYSNLPHASTVLTGLPTSSNLRYYVRTNCGTSQSIWQGPNYIFLAKTLPYTNNIDDFTRDGFFNFQLYDSAINTPANYADGGSGKALLLLYNNTNPLNDRGYTRAISLQAGDVIALNFKTRLYPATGNPMTFNVTVGTEQNPNTQTTILLSFTENNASQYTPRTAMYTAPTTGIYYFSFHRTSTPITDSTITFFDTFEITNILSNSAFSNLEFSIYPNPTTGIINITNNNNNLISEIEVTDLNGRIVKKVSNKDNISQLNISELSQGVYLMKIISDNGFVYKKIIKE